MFSPCHVMAAHNVRKADVYACSSRAFFTLIITPTAYFRQTLALSCNLSDMFHRQRPIHDCSVPRCLLRVVDAASLRENAPSEDQRGILHAVVVQVHSKQAVHLAKFFDLFQ